MPGAQICLDEQMGAVSGPCSSELRWAVGGDGWQSLSRGLLYKLVTAPCEGGHGVLGVHSWRQWDFGVCTQRDGGSWYPCAGGCYCQVQQT